MHMRAFSIVAVTTGSLLLSSGHVMGKQFVTGQCSSANVTLNSAANWTVIRSATVYVLPFGDTGSHGCVASASADMDFNGSSGVENKYRFALARNNANPVTNTSSERILELFDNTGVNDPDSRPVSTTDYYTNIRHNNGTNGSGSHTFYFLGRKVQAADATADVLDASLSISCIHTS